jgi:hypothetical protein
MKEREGRGGDGEEERWAGEGGGRTRGGEREETRAARGGRGKERRNCQAGEKKEMSWRTESPQGREGQTIEGEKTQNTRKGR